MPTLIKDSKSMHFMIPMTELFLKGRFPLLKIPNFYHLIHLFYIIIFSDTSFLKSNVQFTLEIHHQILKNMSCYKRKRKSDTTTLTKGEKKSLKISYLTVFNSKGKK